MDETETENSFEPTVYPACTKCGRAWLMRRAREIWVWSPDCEHKNDSCRLVRS